MQPRDHPDSLRRAHAVARTLHLAIGASLLVYVVAEVVLRESRPTEIGDLDVMRYVLLAVAVASLLAIPVIRRFLLASTPMPASDPADEGQRYSPRAQRLLSAAVVTAALAESVAVFGLVLFLLGGTSVEFYALVGLSALALVLTFPRLSQWEQWASERDALGVR